VVNTHEGGVGLGGELGVVDVVWRCLEVEEFDCVGVVSEVMVDWGMGRFVLEEGLEGSAGCVGVF